MKVLAMESFFLGLVLVCMIIWRILSTTHKRNKTSPPPEPSGAWPLIGHLRILNSQIPFFRTLGDLADKHGPVFSIRLGMRRTLVISSWESVKECLKTNDRKFLNRPSFAASKYMGYDDAFFGFHPYGEYWLETRKIATQELLSNRRLELLKHVRVSEIETCIKELHTTCSNGSVLVDMSQWFSCVIANVMFRLIAGKRYCSGIGKDSGAFGGLIKEFFYLAGVLVISDLIPFTEWMDLQGHMKSMKRVAKELDHVVSGWLEEHLQRREEGRVRKEEKDFMDVMLESLAVGDDPIFGYKRETIVKGTALNLIVAGDLGPAGEANHFANGLAKQGVPRLQFSVQKVAGDEKSRAHSGGVSSSESALSVACLRFLLRRLPPESAQLCNDIGHNYQNAKLEQE
ncbi:hypothetical protein POTOM_051139 [Populus tomentosa]|uniref:Uncharacterized protein n=1 Tax=Populus tomentosa TaxID=118781 RepID=A0A8X7Y500_POPTO|nr:hypothetical protein POTOM_051139 [Populus tomentosa]